MRRLLLALAFSLAVVAARAEAITAATWGCGDLETVERMNEAISAGDRRAADAILDSGDCVWWTPGTRIQPIDRYPDWDLVCVARLGSQIGAIGQIERPPTSARNENPCQSPLPSDSYSAQFAPLS